MPYQAYSCQVIYTYLLRSGYDAGAWTSARGRWRSGRSNPTTGTRWREASTDSANGRATGAFCRLAAPFPQAELSYLTEVDHHDHEALVAVDPETNEGVGVARFVRSAEDPAVAELAVAVADDWQGQGVGSLLAGRAGQASARGGDHVLHGAGARRERRDPRPPAGPRRGPIPAAPSLAPSSSRSICPTTGSAACGGCCVPSRAAMSPSCSGAPAAAGLAGRRAG